MATKTQFLTVLLSAVLAGFGGGLLAGLIGHVDPASARPSQVNPMTAEVAKL